jgi:hypothetical protein
MVGTTMVVPTQMKRLMNSDVFHHQCLTINACIGREIGCTKEV